MNKERIYYEIRKWKERTLGKFLKKLPERQAEEEFQNLSGIPVRRLYTPADFFDEEYMKHLGFPGDPPFTRGPYPTMYRSRFPTMRLFAGFALAEDLNKRFKFLLKQGGTGLSTAFDVPTLLGEDSDHPDGRDNIGKGGVAIDTFRDMEILFDDIPLDQVSTSMTINAPAAIIFAMYLVAAEKQGLSWKKLRGTTQADILKEFLSQHEVIVPLRSSVKLLIDKIIFSAENVPQWSPISVSGYHIREYGSTALQELAFTLADGLQYALDCQKRGINPNKFLPRFSFFFNSHDNFLEEVAKFRAARLLWARLLEKYVSPNLKPESLRLKMHVQTGGSTLVMREARNNTIRSTAQALAATFGGAQSIHVDAWDEALGLPSEESARMALRTLQIIFHETGVADIVDPLGGSYAVESLTKEMAFRAEKMIDEIWSKYGDMTEAVKHRAPKRQIQAASRRYYLSRKKVGVDIFRGEVEGEKERFRISPKTADRQLERLKEVKRERSARGVLKALKDLETICRKGENIMPATIEAVREYATVGEICGVWKEVFGEDPTGGL